VNNDKYDFSELRGLIAKRHMTAASLSRKIGLSETTMYSKLNNNTEFTQSEIKKIADVLNINPEDIPLYFF